MRHSRSCLSPGLDPLRSCLRPDLSRFRSRYASVLSPSRFVSVSVFWILVFSIFLALCFLLDLVGWQIFDVDDAKFVQFSLKAQIVSENERFFRQMSPKMYKSVHRMQSKNKADTKVVSLRPEIERFGLGTCLCIFDGFFD